MTDPGAAAVTLVACDDADCDYGWARIVCPNCGKEFEDGETWEWWHEGLRKGAVWAPTEVECESCAAFLVVEVGAMGEITVRRRDT